MPDIQEGHTIENVIRKIALSRQLIFSALFKNSIVEIDKVIAVLVVSTVSLNYDMRTSVDDDNKK